MCPNRDLNRNKCTEIDFDSDENNFLFWMDTV